MGSVTPALAHTGGHLLEAHLQEVAQQASQFSKPFDAQRFAHLAGLWHDLGKYREGFQRYFKAPPPSTSCPETSVVNAGRRSDCHP